MKKSILLLLFFIGLQSLSVQTLEPKLYANIPIGLNVLLVGVSHSEDAIPESQFLGLEEPNLNINRAFLAYGRLVVKFEVF